MKLKEHLLIALDSIRANLVRSIITSLIIALGIVALVGVLTSVDGIKRSINQKFSEIGANSFTIIDREGDVHFGGGRRRHKAENTPILYREALHFKKEYSYPALVSIYADAGEASTVRYGSAKTDPNISVIGVDENYLDVAGHSIQKGRNFSGSDIKLNNNFVLLGSDVAARLFKKTNPIGKNVLVGSTAYRVIGILKSKGSSIGAGTDRMVCIPVSVAKEKYLKSSTSYSVNVGVASPELLENAIGEATVLMRIIRKHRVADETNFEIIKSDSLANDLIDNLRFLTIAATVIAFITLLGAAIGLLNIMLVSVTERTREIGTRKALGATPKVIMTQFLIEAVTICQVGGILGIFGGIIAGNAVSAAVGGGFIIPWGWMILGVSLCFVVGVAAGFYPARKAARLDPIESLRFE